jgi:hypothetical protein
MVTKYVEVEVEYDLSEFTDEELIEELRDRNSYDYDANLEAIEIVEAYRLKTPGWEDKMIEFVHELAGKLIV